jgi:hypothetical protein
MNLAFWSAHSLPYISACPGTQIKLILLPRLAPVCNLDLLSNISQLVDDVRQFPCKACSTDFESVSIAKLACCGCRINFIAMIMVKASAVKVLDSMGKAYPWDMFISG